MSIEQPGWFQFPNIVVDSYAHLTHSAFRVYAVMCRKTIGWHKIVDAISYSQIQSCTAMGKATISRAIDELLGYDLIECERCEGKTTRYTLKLDTKVYTSSETEPHQFQNCTGTSSKTEHTKETKETIQNTHKNNGDKRHQKQILSSLIKNYKKDHEKYRGFPPTINYGAARKVFQRLLSQNTLECVYGVMDAFLSYEKRNNTTLYDFEKNFDHVYAWLKKEGAKR